ncbi:transmembrane protein 161B isoform X1 [Bombus impatiens]|uniref:Transmembrane protein 161B isoform X1 n=1 Tax=Bombus impatiens TaxID=132113 RepID=A0A6P6F910_BOMIM|nr:transmembrane protein 161B isoform X1 [Bombus impatiens]XP_033203291.1 transmembrane protein 161B isoform X1 [Bombus vancouverensis nearcticus]
MALLGAQLVITLIMVSVIQKVTPHFSLARWILCSTGLTRYLYPTDQQLRTLAGVPKEKPKKGKHTENGKVGDVFHVPRNLDITLESAKITTLDVVHLKYYTECQWLLDFSIYATAVYIMTELYLFAISQIYNYLYPIKDEINLSMLWCSLVLGFAFKVLLSLWVQYFKGEESIGERSTCIVTGFAYLLIAMMVLIVDENNLEIGLDKAYASFNHSASLFLDNQGLSSTGPASKIVVKFFLALWCGLLGSLFTFPGLRVSRMHWDALRYYKDQKLLLLIANISYASPLLLVSLWIKPVSRDYLTVRIFSGMNGPLMTTSAFESMRLIAIIVAVLLKFVLMPMYLQSYLNLAMQRLENQKKEAGRITNVDLQKKIAAVFYYLCVVALQFIVPMIICLFFTFMYKTLGGYTWEGILKGPSLEECPADEPPKSLSNIINAHDNEKTVAQTAQDFQLALSSLKQIFTVDVYRGLLGLATWWSCFALFATTAMGMFYQSYFSNM